MVTTSVYEESIIPNLGMSQLAENKRNCTKIRQPKGDAGCGDFESGVAEQPVKCVTGAVKEQPCACCPYGFHIDRDFVKYTQDVSSGRFKRAKLLKKFRRRSRKSMELNGGFKQQVACLQNVEKERNEISNEPFQSPQSLETQSLFSDSLENVMSDFEETFNRSTSTTAELDQFFQDSDCDPYASISIEEDRPPLPKMRGNYTDATGYAVPSAIASPKAGQQLRINTGSMTAPQARHMDRPRDLWLKSTTSEHLNGHTSLHFLSPGRYNGHSSSPSHYAAPTLFSETELEQYESPNSICSSVEYGSAPFSPIHNAKRDCNASFDCWRTNHPSATRNHSSTLPLASKRNAGPSSLLEVKNRLAATSKHVQSMQEKVKGLLPVRDSAHLGKCEGPNADRGQIYRTKLNFAQPAAQLQSMHAVPSRSATTSPLFLVAPPIPPRSISHQQTKLISRPSVHQAQQVTHNKSQEDIIVQESLCKGDENENRLRNVSPPRKLERLKGHQYIRSAGYCSDSEFTLGDGYMTSDVFQDPFFTKPDRILVKPPNVLPSTAPPIPPRPKAVEPQPQVVTATDAKQFKSIGVGDAPINVVNSLSACEHCFLGSTKKVCISFGVQTESNYSDPTVISVGINTMEFSQSCQRCNTPKCTAATDTFEGFGSRDAGTSANIQLPCQDCMLRVQIEANRTTCNASTEMELIKLENTACGSDATLAMCSSEQQCEVPLMHDSGMVTEIAKSWNIGVQTQNSLDFDAKLEHAVTTVNFVPSSPSKTSSHVGTCTTAVSLRSCGSVTDRRSATFHKSSLTEIDACDLQKMLSETSSCSTLHSQATNTHPVHISELKETESKLVGWDHPSVRTAYINTDSVTLVSRSVTATPWTKDVAAGVRMTVAAPKPNRLPVRCCSKCPEVFVLRNTTPSSAPNPGRSLMSGVAASCNTERRTLVSRGVGECSVEKDVMAELCPQCADADSSKVARANEGVDAATETESPSLVAKHSQISITSEDKETSVEHLQGSRSASNICVTDTETIAKAAVEDGPQAVSDKKDYIPDILVCPKCKCPVAKDEILPQNLTCTQFRSLELEEHRTEEEIGSSTASPTQKINFSNPRPTRATALSRAAATKKLLTSSPKSSTATSPDQQFKRGNFMSKSLRVDGQKKNHLTYVAAKSNPDAAKPKNLNERAMGVSSTNGLRKKLMIKSQSSSEALGRSLNLKPRTLGSGSRQPLWLNENVEDAEVEDKLTPLPSEMVDSGPSSYASEENVSGIEIEDASVELKLKGSSTNESSSDATDDELESADEGSYETISGQISSKPAKCATVPSSPRQEHHQKGFELTDQIKEACSVLQKDFAGSTSLTDSKKVWARQYLQHEWLKAAARKGASASVVEEFMDVVEEYGRSVFRFVVNMCDHNDNSALHYAVSHGKFEVISALLDSKVCNINNANRAGYTPVMLAALCPLETETEKIVVQRLFQMGDVNVKASQHKQTALMLAVSHGRLESTQLLLEAGAGVNIQDEDGSTALMCAAEHGHKEIVKLLLAHEDINANISDNDGSTALSIAVDTGHRDIGVLIYAHLNHGGKHFAIPHSPLPVTTV